MLVFKNITRLWNLCGNQAAEAKNLSGNFKTFLNHIKFFYNQVRFESRFQNKIH